MRNTQKFDFGFFRVFRVFRGYHGAMIPQLITEIPGLQSRDLARRLGGSESRNVTYLAADFPVFWERAEGANGWDADGNRFLDLTSAFGVDFY